MDTENQSPTNQPPVNKEEENTESGTEQVQKSGKSPSRLPSIRTFHRDAEAAQGKKSADSFTPSQQTAPPKKEEPAKKPQEEAVPQSASGFVPPKTLHRANTTAPQPERKKPEQSQKTEPPKSALEKKPKKSIVHTYEDDASRALEEKKGSVASIAVAEQKRQQERGVKKERSPWKTYLVRTITVILFACGIGALGYVFLLSRGPGTADIQPEQSIIFTEEVEQMNVSGFSAAELRATINSFVREEVPTDSVHELRLTRPTDAEGSTLQIPIDSEEFIMRTGLERRAPLARALGGRIMVVDFGTPHEGSALIADVSSYDSAFASMIRWEPTAVDDLSFLLPAPTISTAATSTETAVRQDGFVDIIIENRDARVLYGKNGKIRLLYSFPSTHTLVITNSDEVYRAILERLERRTFIR